MNLTLQNRGVLESKYLIICHKLWTIRFYLSTVIYHGVLHGVGLVLAFLTWNAKSDVLNDYHYNTAIIAVTAAFIAFFMLPQVLLISDYPTLVEFYGEFGVFSLSTLFLGLTFIPKVDMHINQN